MRPPQILRMSTLEPVDFEFLSTPVLDGYSAASFGFIRLYTWPASYDIHALWMYPGTADRDDAADLAFTLIDPRGRVLATSGYRSDLVPIGAAFVAGQWLPIDLHAEAGERWQFQFSSDVNLPGRVPILALVTKPGESSP